uniref:Uncharacterized protein C19orf43 n=1 Tax=Culex pipiens TaxID=7175 RepID=A0A8D8HC11_CULPI
MLDNDDDVLRSELEVRERRGGRYGDAYRDRYRDDHRHRRHRSDRRTDRYRGGDRYERDYSRRDRSKSRERRRRSRSRESKHRDRSRERSHGRGEHSKDRDRTRRDLSVEIEQELQNLRKLSDMKAALAKAKQQARQSDSDDTERRKDKIDFSQLFKPVEKQKKDDFMKQFNNGNSSKADFVPEIQTEEERIEFQKKMQEKLQAHLAAEGKLYPKPKPGPAINPATGFANDGSFLEMFKQMQQQTTALAMMQPATSSAIIPEEPVALPYYMAAAAPTASAPSFTQTVKEPVPIPLVGRRRGGKILKTGIVKKPKPIEDATADTPNDAWNLYLQEVKKYKNASCDADSKTRPLVK